MADKKKVVELEVKSNLKETTKDVDNLNNKLKENSDANKDASKSLGGLSKSSELASKGIKGIGTAMKVAGIGLIVSAIAGLMAVFSKNQKVVDTLTTAMNTLQLGFNAVSDVISGVFKSVSEATGGFESLKKVGLGLITLVLTPLRLQFNALKLGLQGLKLAYEKVFGDDEGVEKAKADIEETKKAIKELGEGFVKAGKDVVKEFGGAVSEVGKLAVGVADGISKINPKKLLDSAKAMTELANNSQLAEARITGLIEEYDRQAEKLRQIRDEERNTIDERRDANNKLKEVLEEQTKAMLRQAEVVVANAQAQFNANKSIENEVALINALNEKKGVLAQIEGFISEQKANDLALDKEAIELVQTKAEAENSLAIQKKRFTAEQITNDEMRLEALKSVLEEEKLIELQRLEDKKALYKEGTQAYVDAEIELNAKKQEFYEAEVELENERKEAKAQKEAEEKEKAEEERLADLERRKTIQEERIALEEEESQKKKQINEQYIGFAQGLTGLLSQITGKNKAVALAGLLVEKGSAIAKVITSAQESIAQQVAQESKIPALIPTPSGLAVPNPTKVASAGKTLASISKTKLTAGLSIAQIGATTLSSAGGSVSGGGGISGGGASATFSQGAQDNTFDGLNNDTNSQIAIANANNSGQPVQAYITSTEVASAQALERNRIEGAGF